MTPGIQTHLAFKECSTGDGLTADDLAQMAYNLLTQVVDLVDGGAVLVNPQIVGMINEEVLKIKHGELANVVRTKEAHEIPSIGDRYAARRDERSHSGTGEGD